MPQKRPLARPWIAGTVTAMVLLLLASTPSRGQQYLPRLFLSTLSQAATAPVTSILMDFTVPHGYQLIGEPRVRVIDARNVPVAQLTMQSHQNYPVWNAFTGLNRDRYAPGTYRLRAEIDFRAPRGRRLTAISNVATLTIPPR